MPPSSLSFRPISRHRADVKTCDLSSLSQRRPNVVLLSGHNWNRCGRDRKAALTSTYRPRSGLLGQMAQMAKKLATGNDIYRPPVISNFGRRKFQILAASNFEFRPGHLVRSSFDTLLNHAEFEYDLSFPLRSHFHCRKLN